MVLQTTKPTVHMVQYGHCACGLEMPPSKWPAEHVWASTWEDVTCEECLLGRGEIKTYHLDPRGKSITCLHCNLTSHHPRDVEERYCGHCHVWHDHIWPPARHSWVNSNEICPTKHSPPPGKR